MPSSPLVVATAELIGLRAVTLDRRSRCRAAHEKPPLTSCRSSPHQARVARIPALGEEGDLHGVLDDRLGLLLDLRDHRPGVRAERASSGSS